MLSPNPNPNPNLNLNPNPNPNPNPMPNQARRRAYPEGPPAYSGCRGRSLVGQRVRVFWRGSQLVQQGWYVGPRLQP